MPVIAEVVLEGVTKEQYDAVRAQARWLEETPVGGVGHLTWWEGTTCRNVDVWESEEALGRFSQDRLAPAMAAAGVAVEPKITIHEAHEVFLPEANTFTAT